jgi:hypothetical protein
MYCRTSVKDVNAQALIEQLASAPLVLAIDVAKHDMVAAIRLALKRSAR